MKVLKPIIKAHFNALKLTLVSFLILSLVYLLRGNVEDDINTFLKFSIAGAALVNIVVGGWGASSKGTNKFTWDFYAGLPINKKERLFLSCYMRLFSCFPAILLVAYAVANNINDLSFSILFLSVFTFFSTMTIMVSLFAESISITVRRKQHQKVKSEYVFLNGIRNMSKGFTVALLFGIVIYCLVELSEITSSPTLFFYISTMVLLFALAYLAWALVVKQTQMYQKSFVNPRFLKVKDSIAIVIVLVGVLYGYNHNELSAVGGYGNLARAVRSGDIQTVKSLIRDGADVNHISEPGINALMLSAFKGELEIMKLLYDHGAEPTIKTTKKLTRRSDKELSIFHLAVISKNIKMVKYLMAKDFDLSNALTNNSANSLQLISKDCRATEMLDFLIAEKIYDLNKQNKHGSTAIHLAATNGCFANVVSLREAGADLMIKNKKDKTAFEKVRKRNRDVRYYLKKSMRSPASSEVIKR